MTTEEGSVIDVRENNVVFHDLSLDLVFNVIPFDQKLKPCFFCGLSGYYLFYYRSVIKDFQGNDKEINTDLYDDFNKFT